MLETMNGNFIEEFMEFYSEESVVSLKSNR